MVAFLVQPFGKILAEGTRTGGVGTTELVDGKRVEAAFLVDAVGGVVRAGPIRAALLEDRNRVGLAGLPDPCLVRGIFGEGGVRSRAQQSDGCRDGRYGANLHRLGPRFLSRRLMVYQWLSLEIMLVKSKSSKTVLSANISTVW